MQDQEPKRKIPNSTERLPEGVTFTPGTPYTEKEIELEPDPKLEVLLRDMEEVIANPKLEQPDLPIPTLPKSPKPTPPIPRPEKKARIQPEKKIPTKAERIAMLREIILKNEKIISEAVGELKKIGERIAKQKELAGGPEEGDLSELTHVDIHKMYEGILDRVEKRIELPGEELTGKKTKAELEKIIADNEKLLQENENTIKKATKTIANLRNFLIKFPTSDQIDKISAERPQMEQKERDLAQDIKEGKAKLLKLDKIISFSGNRTPGVVREASRLAKEVKDKEKQWAALRADLLFKTTNEENVRAVQETEVIIESTKRRIKELENFNTSLREYIKNAKILKKD